MNVVENALERVWTRVYDHKIFDSRDGWKFLPGENFRWVWPQKWRNRLFQILIFCFHEASLGLDLRRYACAMDMADSAFERADVRLFKHGIDYDVGGSYVALWRNAFAEYPKITLTRIIAPESPPRSASY